jgi:hypothetical protein
MAANKILGKSVDLGIIKQTNWATPATNSANYLIIHADAGSIVPDPDTQVDQYNTTSQNGIHFEYERRDVDSTSGLPSITYTFPMDSKRLAAHLVGALLAVTEGATTPYDKTITCAGLTAVPNFNGDDCPLHTLAIKPKASADDGMILKNAIVDSLTLTWDFNGRGVGRKGQGSVTWKGNDLDEEVTHSGTWVNTTPVYLNNTDTWTFSTLSIDSVSYASDCVRRVELNINNNVTSNCKTTGGKANNYDIAPEYTMTVILDYNATTEKILKDYQDGARVQAVFTNDVSVGSDGNCSFTAAYGIMTGNPFTYNDAFVGVGITFRIYSNAAATPITAVITDAVDYGY